MGQRFDWLERQGISVREGLAYTGGEAQYISALQRYFRNWEANRAVVAELLAAGDVESYAIRVHALKSNSRMIGAAALGNAFEALEQAAKRSDTAYLSEATATALASYDALCELLRPLGEAEAMPAPGEISAAEARETAEALLSALDEFDDERSAELARKLAGYPFRPAQKAKLDEAARLIGDFLYDEAAGCIHAIVPAIE